MKFYTDKVKEIVPNEVTIVAATKYFTTDQMRELYETGITHFGENRVEVLLEKKQALQDLEITWHMIGTLQTKKTKKIIHDIDYLHSLDTLKLAQEINKRRMTPLSCFVQVNISEEESKHGLDEDEIIPFMREILPLENVNIIGLMGMAAYTDDESVIAESFDKINRIKNQINKELNTQLSELSIGMSNDYKLALKHNATFLRLGSVLFRSDE